MCTRTSKYFPIVAEHKPAKLFLCLTCLPTTWQENPSVAEEIEAEL